MKKSTQKITKQEKITQQENSIINMNYQTLLFSQILANIGTINNF